MKVFLAVVVVIAVIAALAGIKIAQIKKLKDTYGSMPVPKETVSSIAVKEEKWQDQLAAIGSVTAVQGVNVTTETAGTVSEIAFESGAMVKKGDLLVRLDTTTEAAQLRSTESQSKLAETNAERAQQLRKANTISQSELDTADSTLQEMKANADMVHAAIAKKTIRAPFDGQLGIRMVNLGQYLDVGKPIVSLQSLDAMHADFSLPQQSLGKIKTGMKVVLTTDSYPDQKFEGKLTAINPDINVMTRSIPLQATFENQDHLLRPGMFARVELILPETETVMIIPRTSVLSAPFGDSVYVVENKPASTNGPAGLAVRQQFIRTGKVRGDFIAVESGLKTGEKVVTSGLFKLRNGVGVVENNAQAPKTTNAPKPSDS